MGTWSFDHPTRKLVERVAKERACCMRGKSRGWELRAAVIAEWRKGGSVKDICQSYDVPRTTFYSWLKRFRKDGWEGLKDRSRSPMRRTPRRRSRELLDKLRKYVLQHPEVKLQDCSRVFKCPVSTVHDYLLELNLSNRKNRWLALEEMIREQEYPLCKAQREFVCHYNPAFKDLEFSGLHKFTIFQTGFFKKKEEIWCICIHQDTGKIVFLNRKNIISHGRDNLSKKIRLGRAYQERSIVNSFIDILTPYMKSRIHYEDKIYIFPFYMGSRHIIPQSRRLKFLQLNQSLPFGMLERITPFLKEGVNKGMRPSEIEDAWNCRLLPGYPLYGKTPEKAWRQAYPRL